MLKAKPVSLRRKRKSFGGQTGVGIWWRKRSAPTSIPAEEVEGSDPVTPRQDRSSSSSSSSSDPPTDPSGEDSDSCGHSNEEPMSRQATKKKQNKKKDHSSSAERENETAKKSKTKAKAKSPTPFFGTADEAPILGWDDDLCRPIYYQRHTKTICDSFDSELVRAVSSGEHCGVVEATDASSGSDDASSDEEKGNASTDSLNGSSPIVASKYSASCLATASDEVETEREVAVSFRIPVLSSRKRTQTFGNQGPRRRPLSLILTQEEADESPTAFDRGSRRVSLESSVDAAIDPTDEAEEASGARASNTSEDSKNVIGESDRQKQPPKKRRSKRLKADPLHSLEKSRAYFADLDQTQSLTLDAAVPPPVSSRVTRTRRRTNLASPGINRDYEAYSKSITGIGDGHPGTATGIAPLSIRDYASSRTLHFQNKGEIVDGFLDD